MSVLSVIVAGLAAWAFGAVWYSVFAKPWVAASGVATDDTGKPANQKDPLPYILSIISAILVAGMMRHTFNLSGIDTLGKGLISGLGIGAFLAAPWLLTCYAFAGRPRQLMLIDAGYATFGSAVIGAVLMLL
ncbi:DUF1761 domain-containing protein [Marivita sp. S6314]|uniref:DUF1761 domain-containing protein n=1 Tax=Marivita sp. S6314 TaxID=2926406 RepID=UPI001FF276DB|nr:DUF1761 domain-containing protein [Marivita sp. S6314]MCK0151203.1 DUF1761 domain-containing protein [Marivita sp. S6314]